MDQGIAHAIKQMVENHTCLAGFHFRYVLHMDRFFEKSIRPCVEAYPTVAVTFFRYVTPKVVQVSTMAWLGFQVY